MKRALVFLVLAPTLVAVIVTLIVARVAAPPAQDAMPLFATVMFFFTMPVAAIAGSLDTYLARAFAVALRAPLIAAIGAIVSSGLAYVLFSWMMPATNFLPFFAIGGASGAGLCSLLANEYGGQRPAVCANSLLRDR